MSIIFTRDSLDPDQYLGWTVALSYESWTVLWHSAWSRKTQEARRISRCRTSIIYLHQCLSNRKVWYDLLKRLKLCRNSIPWLCTDSQIYIVALKYKNGSPYMVRNHKYSICSQIYIDWNIRMGCHIWETNQYAWECRLIQWKPVLSCPVEVVKEAFHLIPRLRSVIFHAEIFKLWCNTKILRWGWWGNKKLSWVQRGWNRGIEASHCSLRGEWERRGRTSEAGNCFVIGSLKRILWRQ